jgi:hypothetical protein
MLPLVIDMLFLRLHPNKSIRLAGLSSRRYLMAMTKILAVAVVLGVTGGSAFAQISTSISPAASPPVASVPRPDSRPAAAPAAGANSFTETQARDRIEAHGYADVSGLVKDAQSIWRGKATKGGAPVSVALDYQGNIFPSK